MADKVYEFNPDLLDDFIHNRAALFLGAGVSAGVKTRSGTSIKTWISFLNDKLKGVKLPSRTKEIKKILDDGDLLLACELIKGELEETWDSTLRMEYDQIGEVTNIQKAIISLNPKLIVTTNFDKFFENAWDKIKGSTHHLRTEVGINDSSFDAFRCSDPCLFKIHGCISDVESMIFAKGDYIKKAYSSWAYSKFLEVLFTTHTVVFIGFSLADPAISHILEIHANLHPKGRPHYAFLPDELGELKISALKTLKKLYAIQYSPKDNHIGLEKQLRALNTQVAKRRKLVSV